MPHGRPSSYTQEVADTICEMIADGKSLRSICRADDMPDKATVMRWLAHPDRQSFRDQYAQAREIQADSLFDDCLSIADQYDEQEATAEGGTDHIQRARLRIDTRKWMAGKLRPKKYGEKLAIGGSDDMDPIKTEDVNDGAARLVAYLDAINSRTPSEPDAE